MDTKSKLLEGIIDEVEIGLIYCDAEDRIAGFNKTGARIYNKYFGVELTEDMTGTHLDDCHPKEAIEETHEELEKLRNKDPEIDKPQTLISGGIRWMRQLKAIFDQDGNYLGMVEILIPAGFLPLEERSEN